MGSFLKGRKVAERRRIVEEDGLQGRERLDLSRDIDLSRHDWQMPGRMRLIAKAVIIPNQRLDGLSLNRLRGNS